MRLRRRLTRFYAILAVVMFLLVSQLAQHSDHQATRKSFTDDSEGSLGERQVTADVHKHTAEVLEKNTDKESNTDEEKLSNVRMLDGLRDLTNADQITDDEITPLNGQFNEPEDEYTDVTNTSKTDKTFTTQVEVKPETGGMTERVAVETHSFKEHTESVFQSSADSIEYRKGIYHAYFQPSRTKMLVNCSAIVMDDNSAEIAKAKQIMKNWSPVKLPMIKYMKTLDCEHYKIGRGYILHPLSEMERNFPLAFSLIVYRDLEQTERLLRAIYRPHNYYCIHIDMKTDPIERRAFESMAECFDNVVIADKSVNVTWGTFSVLEAELLCMETLFRFKRWKYFINLTGQEFPLKTNRELVSILESLDGANVVDGTWIRARERYFHRWTKAKVPPPHRIRLIKGSVHVAVNRHFVNFSLHDPRSLDFRAWLEKTEIPDETFFSSLNHNPHLGINGSFLGEPEEYPLKPFLIRYKNWQLGHSTFNRDCAGKFVRNICVLGIGDIHRAYTDIGLFANKFHLDFEYLALDCLEDVLYRKTWTQFLNDEVIDTSYYSHLDYVKKKLYVPP